MKQIELDMLGDVDNENFGNNSRDTPNSDIQKS